MALSFFTLCIIAILSLATTGTAKEPLPGCFDWRRPRTCNSINCTETSARKDCCATCYERDDCIDLRSDCVDWMLFHPLACDDPKDVDFPKWCCKSCTITTTTPPQINQTKPINMNIVVQCVTPPCFQ